MDEILFAEYNQHERLEMLKSNSDEIIQMDYTEKLTIEELIEAKNKLALRSIEESRLCDEKKEFTDAFKVKLKPIVEEKDRLITEIKHGSRSLFGDCYKIIDYNKNQVGFYNNRGQLVYSRPSNADEKQKTIFSIKREGTNG
jgi:hypothetical protein